MFIAFVVAFLIVTSPIWLVHTIIEAPWLLLIPLAMFATSKLVDKIYKEMGIK